VAAVLSFTPSEWIIFNSGPVTEAVASMTAPTQDGKESRQPRFIPERWHERAYFWTKSCRRFWNECHRDASGPFYLASMAVGTLTNTGIYKMTGTGGTDVGPFNSTTVFPASFNATNFANITSINRSQPLTLTWTGTGIDQVGM